MIGMRDVITLLENADFDHGHSDASQLHTFDKKEFSDKGRADIDTKGVYPRADNGMAEIDEFAEPEIMPHASHIDQLHQMLTRAKVSDEEIKHGVHLSDHGKDLIAGRFGIGPHDVEALINKLMQSMRDGDEEREENMLSEVYHRMMEDVDPPYEAKQLHALGFTPEKHPRFGYNVYKHANFPNDTVDIGHTGVFYHNQDTGSRRAYESIGQLRQGFGLQEAGHTDRPFEGRYAYEKDKLGSVTVRDADSGDSKFVQGSQATELLDKLSGGENEDAVLGRLFEKAKNPESGGSFADEMTSSGTYNFPWKLGAQHGLATVFFSGGDPPVLRLDSVRNVTGEEIAMNDHQREELTQQAHDFIGHE